MRSIQQWVWSGLGLAIMGLALTSVARAEAPLGDAPEIDGGMLASGLALLSGLAMVVSAKRRPRR